MDKIKGLEILTEVIDKELTHRDYERVTKLADLYYKMKTGDGLTDELRQIVTRETDEEFAQRKTISKSVIPSTLNSTMLPFEKALRKAPLMREILYKEDTKREELEEYIKHYWGEMSVEEYLEFAVIEYNYIDPNAFLLTEFDAFDPKKEKAKPYPFVATSKEAIMFEYKNEILQYLIVKLPIKYIQDKEEKDGYKFTMYLGPDTIQMTETAPSTDAIEINSKYYTYEEFQPKAKKVPARRFGYLRDAETNYRTFVSVFHPVILLIEKMMKTDSELDLSTAFTAFPQRFAYVDKCSNKDCHGGKLLDGKTTCSHCNGSGHEPIHSGVKDVVVLTMPHNPADMVSLENLLVYKTPPLELLNFNKEYINDLRKLVHAMMFNAEIFSKTEVTQTATQKILETDNMNDTLYPFARNYSATWEFVVADIAEFTDLGDVQLHHKFPNDFKFKTLTELMGELKSAKDAGASTSTISAIEDDINELLYSDRPGDLKKIQIKSMINPFRGYDEGSVRLLISQGKTTEFNAVLWANLESIFNELELEDPGVYTMAFKVVNDRVREKTLSYIEQINAEKPEELKQFNTFQ